MKKNIKTKSLSVLLAALMILSVMSIVCYAYTNIDFISIQGVTAPKAGAKPSYDGVNNNNATNFRIWTEYAPESMNNDFTSPWSKYSSILDTPERSSCDTSTSIFSNCGAFSNASAICWVSEPENMYFCTDPIV